MQLRRQLLRVGRMVGYLAPLTASTYSVTRVARADARALVPLHTSVGAAGGDPGGNGLAEQIWRQLLDASATNQFTQGGVTLMLIGAAVAAARGAFLFRCAPPREPHLL